MTTKKRAPQSSPHTSGANNRLLDLSTESIPFSALVDNRMRVLKAKTGITPNVLARIGFCLSLEEPGVPMDPFVDEQVGREIKRTTLLGEYDQLFICMLRTWIFKTLPTEQLQQKDFDSLFVAHMNRGFELVSARIRSLADLQNLLPEVPA